MLSYNLLIDQGSDFRIRFPVLDSANAPVDVTDWQVNAQVRSLAASPEVLYAWADAGGEGMTDGTHVVLTVPAVDSADWAWTHGVYDVEIISPDDTVTRLVGGHVFVTPEITR